MTKIEFVSSVKALYRVGNYSDSDSDRREDWTHSNMAGPACCGPLDEMIRAMGEANVLTASEIQEFYDTV
jgi:hypothetical protein